uniref:SCP domain-containing protein n=1 Tax=Caenorhabditis japonica TaxID=281687 RepID=A0A8R1HR90_CAEJA
MQTILLFSALCLGAYAQFSPAGQQAIVDAHNALRSKIAKGQYVAKEDKKPSGSNILKIKWDKSIAASAQKYADTCPKGHSGAKGLGENLFWLWTTGKVSNLDSYGKSAASGWENEFNKYGWNSNNLDSKLFGTGIGHATQMAWAKTGSIGCGVKDCKSAKGSTITVVCQYKTQGNYLGNSVYYSGATCSACPSGTSCEKSTGLCV